MEILNNVIYLLSYCNIITCETMGLYHIYCRENPLQYRKRYFKIIGSPQSGSNRPLSFVSLTAIESSTSDFLQSCEHTTNMVL